MLDVAHAFIDSLELRRVARPHLTALRDRTNETVHLGAVEGQEIVYLDKVDSAQPVRLYTWVGRRAGIHCTSIGKAILAFRGEGVAREFVATAPLTRLTPKTLVDPDRLLGELAETRRRGYAVDDEEATEGIRCVAAPILDHTSSVIAAVGIAGPVHRVTAERLPTVGLDVLRAGQAISSEMGFRADREVHP
jgi:DNA-binding IclR family transcriptional regulator